MDLLSVFRRSADTAARGGAASEPADTVQQARTRARQRLIGAVVLVGIGIIGFPLVFETQPRPIPVDIPIDIPRKEGAAPLAMPPARAPAATGAVADRSREPGVGAPAPHPPSSARDDVLTETRDEAGRERAAPPVQVPKPAANATAQPSPQVSPAATPKAVPPAAQKPADAKPTASVTDGSRARALLEGKASPGALATSSRFVVQVGAFADASAARETRQKVEKLGLKTYTQVTETASGSRIRVRAGPFATRDEADQAQARARSAGLNAVVLTL
jgi:DedD protein